MLALVLLANLSGQTLLVDHQAVSRIHGYRTVPADSVQVFSPNGEGHVCEPHSTVTRELIHCPGQDARTRQSISPFVSLRFSVDFHPSPVSGDKSLPGYIGASLGQLSDLSSLFDGLVSGVDHRRGVLGGLLREVEREAEKDNADSGQNGHHGSDEVHKTSPLGHLLLGVQIALFALYHLGMFGVALMGFYRSGEALYFVSDGRNVYWWGVVIWGLIGFTGAVLCAAGHMYWL